MVIKVQEATLILLTLIHHLTIMEQRLLLTAQCLLRELCPEQVLHQHLRVNVRRDSTGCLPRQDKPDGACLMREHM